MTTVEVDLHDVQQARRADGLLATFNRAGVLGAADVHVAYRLRRLGGESDERVLLAVALTVRAARQGSVCLDVAHAAATTAVDGVHAEDVAALPWPDPVAWVAAVESSRLVAVGEDGPADRPLRLVDGLLYLDRFWRQERVVAEYVDAAMGVDIEGAAAASWAGAVAPPSPDGVARLFPSAAPDRQRLAAVVAAHRRLSILAGGPGTGKTATVAKLLALLQDRADGRLRLALAAPTGRAAARLQEAATDAAARLPAEDRMRLGDLRASTLHRLLGYRPGARTRFRHDRDNRLPYDVVVVDEASMVSLTMMSRLVEALRPGCRLVLVGDPDQLSSVEVGAVLGDLVERPVPSQRGFVGSPAHAGLSAYEGADLDDLSVRERERALGAGVVRLSRVYRFTEEIRQLAEAIRLGDADAVLEVVGGGRPGIELVEVEDMGMAEPSTLRADVVAAGRALVAAARLGDAETALRSVSRHRVLCGHREGVHGAAYWGSRVEQWLGEEIDGYAKDGFWYVGRPLLVTSNDYQLRLFNGDAGVVVEVDGRPGAAFWRDGELVTLPPSRLSDVETMHALSVHRSQGSQFDRVSVVLPPASSPLATRELLYTAVTRAKEHVRLVGDRESLVAAVNRPINRASGLSRAAGRGRW